MSADRRLGVTVPVEDGLSAGELVDLMVTAEELGYDSALIGEVAGPEVIAVLSSAATRTERIRLGSGIVATYTRPPTLAAMGFATISSLAPGRVIAGLGASSPIVVGQWHGLDFESPLATTREYVEVFRAAMSGEKVEFDGDRLRSSGFRLGIEPGGDVPVWLAAMNPRMLAMAGEIADGVFLTWCPPVEIADKLAGVAEGATRTGRTLEDLEVACSFWAYAGDRPDEARDRMRRSILAYSMVPTHQRAFREGWSALGDAADAWASGDRKAALALVSDDVVHHFCAIGEDEVRSRADAYHEAGVDTVLLLLTGAVPGDASGSADTMTRCAR